MVQPKKKIFFLTFPAMFGAPFACRYLGGFRAEKWVFSRNQFFFQKYIYASIVPYGNKNTSA